MTNATTKPHHDPDDTRVPFLVSVDTDRNQCGLHVRWEKCGNLRYVTLTIPMPVESIETLINGLRRLAEIVESVDLES